MLLVLHKLQHFPFTTSRKDLLPLNRWIFFHLVLDIVTICPDHWNLVITLITNLMGSQSAHISRAIKVSVKRHHTGTADCLFEAVKTCFLPPVAPDVDIVLVKLSFHSYAVTRQLRQRERGAI